MSSILLTLAPTIVTVVAIVPTLLTLFFAVEVLAGLRRNAAVSHQSSQVMTVIVVPAHNEAVVIEATIEELKCCLKSCGIILVVADNCTDDTAAIAHASGAVVIVRENQERVGKGFALAFARDHLAASPPDCVIVIDADCRIDANSIADLASAAIASGRAAQAVNLLEPDLSASATVQVSNFAFMIKNLIRQRGLERLSGRVNLTGTGMAFPWAVFATANLATDNIVEDLALGLDLSRSGGQPVFVSAARVWSSASSTEGTLKQRTRWEGGFLAMSLTNGLPALWAAMRAASFKDVWAALSLLVPPITLLALVDVLVFALALTLGLFVQAWFPLYLLVIVCALAAFATTLAWHAEGRPYLSAAAIRRLPAYILWKIPLYLTLLRRRPISWLRTGR